MKYWQALSFTRTDQLVALARACEDVGFHGVLVSDHFFFPESLRSQYPYSDCTEDAGVTGLVSYPLAYSVGPSATPEQMRAALERYGAEIIARHR